MSNNTEIETLLKSIQQGLKKYGVNELNIALTKALVKDKHPKSHEIDYVIIIVCNEFNISASQLKNSIQRGELQDAKQLAYCLLYFVVGLSTNVIANTIFFNWKNSVSIGIARLKNIDVQHKKDKEFLDKYNYLKGKIEKFIESKNK
jgi:chromosomal replication initiation ATPase DnaA